MQLVSLDLAVERFRCSMEDGYGRIITRWSDPFKGERRLSFAPLGQNAFPLLRGSVFSITTSLGLKSRSHR